MRLSVRQISGLGNQLFQYAAARFFAELYRAEAEILIEPQENAFSYGHARPFLLSKFAIALPTRPFRSSDRFLVNENPRLKSVFNPLRAALGVQIVREQAQEQYRFIPQLPLAAGARIAYLSGYWQAGGYVAETLRSELRLRDAVSGKTSQVQQEIAAKPIPVSVHVRRGDYTLDAEGNRALPLDFYHRAMAILQQRLGAVHFFVFSDDMAFARENLPRALPITFVDHNDSFTAHEDLHLMAACRHHILANSSFSWWGAWLNPRQDKIVVAPRNWLRERDSYFPDLMLPGWILLDW
ncbi:Glycosyl transferase family 11 [Granulicella rosea]|uniref:Glycosyl transferase family 11 n=1 Tax=Granulicella rosea TaxID=474952 RepID=A0A239LBL4_9BACT|nr:alpha-1,2-fucosyltransferase [Granulicella rosea]SNT27861.1 Glycosyl transferase family 11 [Granulicella rosea]